MQPTHTMHEGATGLERGGNTAPELSRPALVSIREACRQFGGIGKTCFYGVVEKHSITLVRLGGRSLVPTSEIVRVVAQLMATSEAPPKKIAAATAASVASRQIKPARRPRRGSSPPP